MTMSFSWISSWFVPMNAPPPPLPPSPVTSPPTISFLQELDEYFASHDTTKRAERFYDKKTVVAKIKNQIHLVEITDGKENKKKMVLKVMDTCVFYRKFVHDFPGLRNMARAKCLEFAIDNDWHLDWHYWQLFQASLEEDMKVVREDIKEKRLSRGEIVKRAFYSKNDE